MQKKFRILKRKKSLEQDCKNLGRRRLDILGPLEKTVLSRLFEVGQGVDPPLPPDAVA